MAYPFDLSSYIWPDIDSGRLPVAPTRLNKNNTIANNVLFLHSFGNELDVSNNEYRLKLGSTVNRSSTYEGQTLSSDGDNTTGYIQIDKQVTLLAGQSYTQFIRLIIPSDTTGAAFNLRSSNEVCISTIAIGNNGIASQDGQFLAIARDVTDSISYTNSGLGLVNDNKVHTLAIKRDAGKYSTSLDGQNWIDFDSAPTGSQGNLTFTATHQAYAQELLNGGIGGLAATFILGGLITYGLSNKEIDSLHSNPIQLFDIPFPVWYVPTATTSLTLTINNLQQPDSLGSLSLIQQNNLTSSSLSQTQALSTLLLTQQNTLSIISLLQASSLYSITLTSLTNLIINSLTQQSNLATLNLLQQNNLSVVNLTQTQLLSTLNLLTGYTITVQSLSTSQLLSFLTLTQQNNLAITSLGQLSNLGTLNLTQANNLIVNSFIEDEQLANVNLTTTINIIPIGLNQLVTLENLLLSSANSLQVNFIVEQVTLNNLQNAILELIQDSSLNLINITTYQFLKTILLRISDSNLSIEGSSIYILSTTKPASIYIVELIKPPSIYIEESTKPIFIYIKE